ncbi:MAG: ribonuclease P protein component [Armatimonadetes bacterium]|nr:MAG: ribonuclease P protein component [Armatimonadota bacterium]
MALLPEAYRLRSKSDFQRVFSEGKALELDAARIVYAPGSGRVAVVVARSLGSAARRNQIRRRWREAVRSRLDAIPRDLDVVLIVRTSAAHLRGKEIENALEEAFACLR